MSAAEKERQYKEAVRYIKNAADILRTKAKKIENYYEDLKYTRMACGTAYSGVLLALDAYLSIKGKSIIKRKTERKSVEDYRKALAKIDQKLLKEYNTTYNVLHLGGYYDGQNKYDIIKSGLESAAIVINKIKPVGSTGIEIN